MRQKNERNIDPIHWSRARDEGGGGGGEEKKEKKNTNFPLKDLYLRPSDFTISSSST